MKYIIRPYTPKDLEDLLSAWENASRLAHSFLSEEFLKQERMNITNLYLPKSETWVVEVDSRVVGSISLLGNEVGGLFLQPAYHGRGLGRALMLKAVEQRGDLVLDVFEKNRIGRKFYESFGFVKTAEKMEEETGEKLICLKYISPK